MIASPPRDSTGKEFFTPPAARIAHGVLVAVGSLWVALAIRRGAGETLRPSQ